MPFIDWSEKNGRADQVSFYLDGDEGDPRSNRRGVGLLFFLGSSEDQLLSYLLVLGSGTE